MILMRATMAKRSRGGSSMNGSSSPSMRKRMRTCRGASAVSMWMSEAPRRTASSISELISRTSALSDSAATSASTCAGRSGALRNCSASACTLSRAAASAGSRTCTAP